MILSNVAVTNTRNMFCCVSVLQGKASVDYWLWLGLVFGFHVHGVTSFSCAFYHVFSGHLYWDV